MKKVLMFTLLFMLFSVSFVSAQERCDVGITLDALRKALYVYYINPEESAEQFTLEDLRGLLSFYIGIQSAEGTVSCSDAQKVLVGRAYVLDDKIPSCADGTKYGKCNYNNKPIYCYAGRLVPRCRLCGCPTDQWCDVTYVYTEKGNKGQWGKCYPGTNVTCVVDSDCGVSDYIGDYYGCIGGDVYRNYTQYTCQNPGETNSSCTTETTPMLIDDCLLGEQCVEGQAECQAVEQPTEQCKEQKSFTDSTQGAHRTTFTLCGETWVLDFHYSSYWCGNYPPEVDIYRGGPPGTGPGFGERITNEDIARIEWISCSPGGSVWTIQYIFTCYNTCTCSDGTPYDTCSTTKPKYCEAGTLIDNCQVCGCDIGTCEADGSCPEEGVIVSEVGEDTIKLSTGQIVRFLGIHVPKLPKVNQRCSPIDWLRNLILGKEVTLEKDVDNFDQEGRFLRYVFFNGRNLNVELVRNGQAIVHIIGNNTKYKSALEGAEESAMYPPECLWLESTDRCTHYVEVADFHWDAEGDDCTNPNGEYITFKNTHWDWCDLQVWTAEDRAGNLYTFPYNFQLYNEKPVTLYSGHGGNTETSLFWGSGKGECPEIWDNDGDALFLRDPEGKLVLAFGY